MKNPWILLLLASVLEILWAFCLKKADGWSNLPWSAATLIVTPLALWLLVLAVKTLPVGTAYAVFTGIGAVGTALISVMFLGEPLNVAKVLSLALVIAGLIGLKLSVA